MRRVDFRKHYFPDACAKDWDDWQWQVRHALRTRRQLERILAPPPAERQALDLREPVLPVSITPYYASLINPNDPADPIRRIVWPSPAELRRSPGERKDPLGEDEHMPVRGLVRSYPSKVLLLVSARCPVYCRYCTRAWLARDGEGFSSVATWRRALGYIQRHPEIRDVLISGGEPLLLPDHRLEWLLARLRRCRHVELLRISTRVPAVLPQRITPELVRMLKRYHPLWMSVHFVHPRELTPEAARACRRLVDAGIPLASQTVLLKGVNDRTAIIRSLMEGLLRMRVKPYYLHQCDAVVGASRFRTPIQRGVEILRGLQGWTSGYAVPHYMVDAPGGGGKVPIAPDYVVGRKGNRLLLRNFAGRRYIYPLPAGDEFAKERRLGPRGSRMTTPRRPSAPAGKQ